MGGRGRLCPVGGSIGRRRTHRHTRLAAATIEGGSHGFGTSTVLAGYAIAALAGAAFLPLEARRVLSLFFQRAQHLSALQTGLAFAPMTLAIMTANALAGRLAHTLGPRG